MIGLLDRWPFGIKAMKKVPKRIEAIGHYRLLNRPMVAIVGSRRPFGYTKGMVVQLAAALAKRGVVVVSGGAIGVDTFAHQGAGSASTIAVLPCGLKYRYPAMNKSLLDSIGREGLLLSMFDTDFRARGWSFVVRNELVVALGEVLIVAQADRQSGSMRSVAYAKAMQKPIYVLPHRLGESEGTNDLLRNGEAEAIYDIEAFVSKWGAAQESVTDSTDRLVAFCRRRPTFEEAYQRFGDRLYEAELEGFIAIQDGHVITL